MSLIKKTGSAFLAMFLSSALAACPCGCGASGPLNLEADQSVRFRSYSGYERAQGSINGHGNRSGYSGPDANLRLGVAGSSKIADSASVFADLAISENIHRESGQHASLADPSFGARWQIQNFVFGRWILTPALFSAAKISVSKGLDDNPDFDDELDIHGNGTHEWMNGFDVEFSDFFLGFSWTEAVIYRLSKEVLWNGGKAWREYGLGLRSSLVAYYTFIGTGRLQVGLVREDRARDEVLSQTIDDSGARSHTLELGSQLRVGDQKTLGLAFFRKGFLGLDRNTYIQNRVELSYSQAI